MLENNQFNIPPPLEKKENSREKLDVEIREAAPEEWKKLRDLRLKILEDEGSKGNIATPRGIEKMKRRTDEQWKDRFFGEDIFSFMALKGSEVVGMGLMEKKNGIWYLYNLGVKKEFRGSGIGPEITAIRLEEIKARGGKEVRTIIKKTNEPSRKIAKSFGFESDKNPLGKLRNIMILDDVNNPTTTKKIEEVLSGNLN